MAAFYDDPHFFYDKYWQTRQYEHQSEVLAIRRLLKKIHVEMAADIGGGYGRLVPTLSQFSNEITLVEPSAKQRQLVKDKLKIINGTSEQTKLPVSSQDLVSIIRVFHHLPQPQSTLKEIQRVLKPHGLLLLEFANSVHFKARLKSLVTGKPILKAPIDIRRPTNIRHNTIPFVNHHPATITKLLTQSHFKVLRILSVSNFRSPLLKRIIPLPILLSLEYLAQSLLSGLYFGPSIFVLAKKKDL